MKRELTEQELVESRLSDAKDKYPELEQYIDVFAEKDPSGGKQKYLQWMVKQLSQQEASPEAAQKILDAVKLYHKNIQRVSKKDINQYKTVQDLVNDVSSLGVSGAQKKKAERAQVHGESDVVYEDEDFAVVRPYTEEASIYYSKGTPWCIGRTTSKNYFPVYSREGVAFYIVTSKNLDNEDDGKKVAFAIEEDGSVNHFDLPNDPAGISVNQVQEHFSRNIEEGPANISVEEADDKAAVFYGKIAAIMSRHLKKNPVDKSKFGDGTEEFQKVVEEHERRSNGSSRIYFRQDPLELTFYGYGSVTIELDKELTKDVKGEEEVEFWIEAILKKKYKLDYDKLDLSENGVGFLFSITLDYSSREVEDSEQFEDFSYQLLDVEKQMDDIKADIGKFLEEFGYSEQPDDQLQEASPSIKQQKQYKKGNDKVRKLTEQELIESRLSDAKEKYPELEQYIDVFAEKDPSGGKQKYLQWMVKQLSQQEASPETAQKILDAVKLYHKNIQRVSKKDINQYKTVDELASEVSNLGKSQTTKRKEKKEQAMEGSEIVLDDGDFFIVRPFTEQASCYYGKQTRWCISATESENYFERYSKEGHAFYFLRNNHLGADDDGKKIAFVFDDSDLLVDYFNAPDDSISDSDVSYHVMRNLIRSGKPEFQQMEEKGTLESHADEVLETLENLMFEHLDKNPVDTSEFGPGEEEYQEIVDEHNSKSRFTSMTMEQLDDSNDFYYDGYGGFSIDINEEPEDEEEIENFIRDALDKNRVYLDESDIEVQTTARGLELSVFMRFSEEYGYSLDNMQAMSNEMLEMEDGIAKAKQATEEFLMSKGYIDKPEEPQKEPQPGDQLEMFESTLLAKPSKNTDQLIEAIIRRLQKIVK